MDREKVVKGLECCSQPKKENCMQCPYRYSMYPSGDREDWLRSCQELYKDTLALLKEQEAVEPSFKQDEKGIFVWCCGSCGAYMYHIYDGIDKAKEYAKFCRQCGKPVMWEGW